MRLRESNHTWGNFSNKGGGGGGGGVGRGWGYGCTR